VKITYKLGLAALLSSLALGLSLPAGAAPAKITTRTAPAVTGSVDPVSGYLSLSGSLTRTWVNLSGGYVASNSQMSVSSVSMTVGGVARRYVVMRPAAVVANAPVLLMLHPNSTTPEATATLSEVADYAATQGFWAVLSAAVGGVWKDDPAKTGAEDVTFITSLITQLVGQGANASRIYVSGYSNGGFMATRLACAASDRIAAFGIVAATTRVGLTSSCGTPVSRPKAWFLGTTDSVVPYTGAFDMRSADSTLTWWNGRQGCAGVLATSVPNRVTTDGTTVQQVRYTGCAGGGENQLYTVTGGGHTWPGGVMQAAAYGAVTMDVKATGLIWNFVRGYLR
jgi:polyhydroxybutyrate depolymerase